HRRFLGCARPHVVPDLSAQSADSARECAELSELGAVAKLAPVRMIDVLLAPALVTPGRLDVPARILAVPNLRPGRRHRERGEPRSDHGIADALAAGTQINEAASVAAPRESRLIAVYVA